jgi:hypothetical protein
MHFRRLACILLGAWLGGIALMGLVVSHNFNTVDRLLLDPAPAASQELKIMGKDFARMLLRWEAAEQARSLFEVWESVQLALGLAVFFVLLFGSAETRFALTVALLMLTVALVQRVLLTPLMTPLGRLIEFTPPALRSPDRIRFQVLHAGYMGLDFAKVIFGFVLAGKLMIRSRRRSSQSVDNLDVVNKTYHRHVNR